MIQKQNLTQTLNCYKVLEIPSIVSEFYTQKLHYLIILIGNVVEPNRKEEILSSFLANRGIYIFSEVDRFRIDGRLYAIVETDIAKTYFKEDPKDLLTERELEIAALVAKGLPNKQIASQLCISEWTVATHLRRIFAKLNVDSRAAMVYSCADCIQQWNALSVPDS